jgi:hypothetical protein
MYEEQGDAGEKEHMDPASLMKKKVQNSPRD